MQSAFDFIVILIGVSFSLALFYVILCRLTTKKSIKYSITMLLFCCGYGVISHASKQSIIYAKITEFQNAFYNNEILVCTQDNTEVHVSKTTFVYFKDLDLFSGKDSMKGLNVPILSCTQHVTAYDSNFIND